MNRNTFKKYGILLGCVCLWLIINIPGILYGTKNLPLHQSYVGDEQSPINGALHVLQDKSLLALRNQPNLYYGPVFATIAIPAVIMDFGTKYLLGTVSGAFSYKHQILYDWGGILVWARILATLVGFAGISGVYCLFSTQILGMNQKIRLTAVLLVATNYYYFEYNHFFKHWIFLCTIFIWELVLIVKILEDTARLKIKKYYLFLTILTLLSFGISYLSLLYQIVWIPIILRWIHNRNRDSIYGFLRYLLMIIIGSGLIIYWHPYAFTRLLKGNAFIVMTQEISSWGYYLKLLFLNHLTLWIALVIMLYAFLKNLKTVVWNERLSIVWACFLGAIANFILFGIQYRAEGRYMLPTIIYGIIGGIILFTSIKNELNLKFIRVIQICVIVTIIFHVISIVGWNLAYAKGHPEQRFIETLTQEYENDNNAKFLVVTDYLIGAIHTKEAYMAYASSTDKTDLNLFKELITSDPPISMTPLPIYYYLPPDLYSDKNKLYDFLLDPKIDQKLIPPGITEMYVKRMLRIEPNQFDYFDEDITRIWFFDNLYYTYERLVF